MNLEKTNVILGITVNVAVLFSIGLLIFELNQNRALTAAQILNDQTADYNETIRYNSQPENLSLRLKLDAGEALSPLELGRYNAMVEVELWNYNNYYFTSRQGLFSREESENTTAGILNAFENTPLFAENFERMKPLLPSPFVEYVEDLLRTRSI